jgi:hypothetical protein
MPLQEGEVQGIAGDQSRWNRQPEPRKNSLVEVKAAAISRFDPYRGGASVVGQQEHSAGTEYDSNPTTTSSIGLAWFRRASAAPRSPNHDEQTES